MRKSLITALAVGAFSASGAFAMAAHAADVLPGPPSHYSSGCQKASTMYQNSGFAANPAGNGLPGEPTIDLPAPLPSQDNGWTYTDSSGVVHSGSYGNGATGISGSDGYLEASGNTATPSGHISGSTQGQPTDPVANGYIGNDGTGNGTVCVAGTTVVP
jgi:hypothetical protein